MLKQQNTKPRSGQAAFGARWRGAPRGARRVARIEAVRHRPEPLGVERLHRVRHGETVDQDVVVPVGAQRAGKADRIDLDRRRTLREQVLARMRRIAVEVEQDGDAVVADALRNRSVSVSPLTSA